MDCLSEICKTIHKKAPTTTVSFALLQTRSMYEKNPICICYIAPNRSPKIRYLGINMILVINLMKCAGIYMLKTTKH